MEFPWSVSSVANGKLGSSSRPFSSTKQGSSKASSPIPGTPTKNDRRMIRKKAERGPLPSSHHQDVEPPSLMIVQRALTSHITMQRKQTWTPKPCPQSAYFDDVGRMLVSGSRGGKYVGDLMGALPHGHGQHWVQLSPKEEEHLLYEGEWQYGGKTGVGWYFYVNGQEYLGAVYLGEHHGKGAMRYNDGSVYDGQWCKSRRHGIGTFYYSDGECYIGNWMKDNRDGWGTQYWPTKARKYEGEWNGDDPLCGRWSTMTSADFDTISKRITWPTASLKLLQRGYPEEKIEVPFQGLHNPELCYYPRCCTIRTKQLEGVNLRKMLTKDGGKQIGSLTTHQMDALWFAFDELAPSYYRRAKLHVVQLRRLLLLAHINPDGNPGGKLLARLLLSAMQTNGLTFNNLIHLILTFHDP
ncbi:unnamed protein product [Sphagnum compactum]